jgi:hypothetical protein
MTKVYQKFISLFIFIRSIARKLSTVFLARQLILLEVS